MADPIPQALVKRVQQANHKHHHGTAGTALLMASKSGKSSSEFIDFSSLFFFWHSTYPGDQVLFGIPYGHGHLTGNYHSVLRKSHGYKPILRGTQCLAISDCIWMII